MNWFYMDGGQQQGPVGDDEIISLIRSGTLSRSTPVWREGLENWLEAEKTEMAASFTAQETVTPPPYRKTDVQTVHEQPTAVQPRKKKSCYFKWMGFAAFVFGLVWYFYSHERKGLVLAGVGFCFMTGFWGTSD